LLGAPARCIYVLRGALVSGMTVARFARAVCALVLAAAAAAGCAGPLQDNMQSPCGIVLQACAAALLFAALELSSPGVRAHILTLQFALFSLDNSTIEVRFGRTDAGPPL